jgi:3-hydroxyacyl-[acyl-carrier-protein] dehydratase
MPEAAAGATLESADILQIMSQLPHRYPFLYRSHLRHPHDESCVGVKNVTINEPQFQGHFRRQCRAHEAWRRPPGHRHRAEGGRSVSFISHDRQCEIRKPVTPGPREFHMAKTLKRNICGILGAR